MLKVILTPIIFISAFILAIFIALFDLIRFPVDIVIDYWRNN